MAPLERSAFSPFPDAHQSAVTPPAIHDSLARLEQAVADIHDGDTFRRYLDAQARFHRYSWGNVLLIVAQRPDATRVAGYRTWQSLGRQVRRGERGIRILVPLWRGERLDVAEADLEDSPSGADDEARRRPGQVTFGTGAVFDVSQTEGAPLPQVQVPVLEGQEGRALFGQLERVAHHEGLAVERARDGLDPSTMGFYAPLERRIVLRDAAPLQMTKTLAHELAHHFSGANSSSPHEETLAESVAYVVCARFGLDTGERSFPYVATWCRETSVLRAALARVQSLSALLIAEVEALELDRPAPERSHAGA